MATKSRQKMVLTGQLRQGSQEMEVKEGRQRKLQQEMSIEKLRQLDKKKGPQTKMKR